MKSLASIATALLLALSLAACAIGGDARLGDHQNGIGAGVHGSVGGDGVSVGGHAGAHLGGHGFDVGTGAGLH